MSRTPLEPARIDWSGAVPRAPQYDDLYHPAIGAFEQARHVFLGGNGLPGRWAGRERFVVLETGFGLGLNFVATWQAWRDDAARCGRLEFVSIERHPPAHADLARAHAASPALARELVERWPPALPGLHPISLDGGRVRLLLAFGDVAQMLPALQLRADAVFLDGFAPARNPAMWDGAVLKAIGRLAAPGATAATWSAARSVRDGLVAAGFEVEATAGIGGKRDITRARYAPRWAGGAADPVAAPASGRTAAVVGAGIAGLEAAAALADEGFEVRLIDRQPHPATETTGNPGGLFHAGLPGRDDTGAHARWLRAAALHAARRYGPAIRRGAVAGAADGLLWLDRAGAAAEACSDIGGHARRVDAAEASSLAGVPLARGGWWLEQGGWIAPAAWAREVLRTSARIAFMGGVSVERIEPRPGGGWRLVTKGPTTPIDADVVVLANAADATRLAATIGAALPPLQRRRGQLSVMHQPAPRLERPLCGDGYALSLPDGRLLFGATSAAADAGTGLHAADHAFNAERLHRLAGLDLRDAIHRLDGRAGERVQPADRLPLAGPLRADATALDARAPLRRQAATPGLYVLAGLGSRGLTLAPLLARLVAAMAAGAPWPVEAELAEAVDPRRAAWRALRRAVANAGSTNAEASGPAGP